MRHILIREELQQRKDWLQTLIVCSPDAIITADPRGRITYWMPGGGGVARLPGPGSARQAGIRFLCRRGIEARQVMETLRVQGKLVSHGCAVRARDGRLVDVSLSASLLPLPGQAGPATLGILTDITPLKELEGRLERTIGMLREANERLERLATTDALSRILSLFQDTRTVR